MLGHSIYRQIKCLLKMMPGYFSAF